MQQNSYKTVFYGLCYYTSVKEKSLREANRLRKISLSAVALVTVSMEMNVVLDNV